MERGRGYESKVSIGGLTNRGLKKANIIQKVAVEPDRTGWGRLMDMYRFYTHLLKIPDVRLNRAYFPPTYSSLTLAWFRLTYKRFLGQRSSAV